MNYTEVRAWMDAQVEHIQNGKNNEMCGSEIVAIAPAYVTLYIGIDIVADIMELEVTERYYADRKCPYYYSLTYKDIEFTQISETQLDIKRKVTILC